MPFIPGFVGLSRARHFGRDHLPLQSRIPPRLGGGFDNPLHPYVNQFQLVGIGKRPDLLDYLLNDRASGRVCCFLGGRGRVGCIQSMLTPDRFLPRRLVP